MLRNDTATRRTDTAARRTVAESDDYTEARRTAELLADSGIPPDKVAIVGHDFSPAEQEVARSTTAAAAALGAAEGALLGAFFGVLMVVVFAYEPDVAVPLIILYCILLGALVGGVLGALLYAILGHPRPAPPGVEAARYEVVVDEDVAAQAEQMLRPAEA